MSAQQSRGAARVRSTNEVFCDTFDISKLGSRGGGLGDGDHIMNASLPSLLVHDGVQSSKPPEIEDLPALLRQSGGKQSVR